MKRLILVLVLGMLCPLVVGADYKAGMDAYYRGDYAKALRELRPLAEHGNAQPQNVLGGMYDNGAERRLIAAASRITGAAAGNIIATIMTHHMQNMSSA